MKLDDAVNLADIEAIAKRRLPSVITDTVAGGAGDELSLRSNPAAFREIEFRPRPLVDVTKRTLATTVLGDAVSMPVFLAPTGAGRIVHRSAELAVAAAAGDAGTVYVQSTVSSYPLEDVAQASDGPLWYQLYLPGTREETKALLQRVRAAGYRALVMTIDTPIFGNRERDRRNRLLGSKLRPKFLIQGAMRPRWGMEFLRGNVGPGLTRGGTKKLTLKETQAMVMATSYAVTWNDVAMVRELWEGPLLLKGIMRADECHALIGIGVDGFVVSNHGGRQLDGLPAPIDVLPSVVEAVGGRATVIVDGGIRRGTDVVKAIALGADACLVGRPYLYGLAAGGQAGVRRVLEILRGEVDTTMALLGCATIGDIDASLVQQRGESRSTPVAHPTTTTPEVPAWPS